ncbi:hypothetical protein [Paracoccus ravus]|uniref:hypothetical protein n=1 Tax=Paracoccus ravus TaxID=2447760 RepID=UPI00106ED8DC|nr:hypothetical protein [Paracoccus ravus]
MIELLFVTCLTASPTQCQDRSLLFANEVGLMTCMLHGQTQLAQWIETHPRETVQKWGCRLRGKGQVET